MPLYKMILFDDLRFTPEFFKEREKTINEKLRNAGTDLAARTAISSPSTSAFTWPSASS